MTEAHKAHPSRWSIIVRIAVAVLVVVGLFCFADWDVAAVRSAFARLDFFVVAAAVVLFMAANVVMAVRWWLLLRAQHIRLSLYACIKVHYLGMFYNNILISSIGGDILRAWYIAKHTHKRLEAAFSVVIDRLIGLGTLVLMALSFYLLFPVGPDEARVPLTFRGGLIARLLHYRVYLCASVAVLAIIVGAMLLHSGMRKKMRLAWGFLLAQAKRVWIAIRLYAARPVSILCGAGLTFVAQSLPIVGFWLIGESMNLPVPLKYYFVFFPIGWVIGAVPVSPAGLGILEVGIVFLFTRVPGVSYEDALVLAICQRVMFLLGSLPGIVIHVLGGHLPSTASCEPGGTMGRDPKL